MPVIKVEYDDAIVSEPDARLVCEAVQKIVSEITAIEDVFVYGNSSPIKIKVAPIEIWVEMSDHKIADQDELIKSFADKLHAWKEEASYSHPINLTLVPMHWKLKIDV